MRIALFLSAALLSTASSAASSAVEGRWVNPKRSVVMIIAPCGVDLMCGTVAWASDQAKADARKGTDALVGAQLLSDLAPKAPGQWQGKLFIPDKNMWVTARIILGSDDRLKVTGCAILCMSQHWTRLIEPAPTNYAKGR